MRLQYGIAVNLGFIAFLSSFMLALGGREFWLPVLVFFAWMGSFYLTDLSRRVILSDGVANIILLLIVFATIGDIVRYRGEGLALSIARVVIFVQAVLLFKKKTPRNCWHILILSFLQVVVASVFPQTTPYALLLVLFVFASLCAFCLIFLYKENLYYRRHSFHRSRQERLETEWQFKKQDKTRLAKIALATLFTGPLAFFISFNDRKSKHADSEDASVDDVEPGKGKANTWDVDSLWEAGRGDSDDADGKNVDEEAAEEHRPFSAVATGPRFGFNRFRHRNAEKPRRWPLLEEVPRFSGGTRRNGTVGDKRSLYFRLAKWTLFSLVFSVVVFFLFPRFEQVEFFGVQFSYENWQGNTQPVAGVGFTENVRLGSLGNVLQQHREVMSVRFFHDAPFRLEGARPYTEIDGQTVYFRGVTLIHYNYGLWNDRPTGTPFQGNSPSVEGGSVPEELESLRAGSLTMKRPFPFRMSPGGHYNRSWGDEVLFIPDGDLVTLVMRVQPLNSETLFAPWPFWLSPVRSSHRYGDHVVNIQNGRLRRNIRRREPLDLLLCTAAFHQGRQYPLTPCQERVTAEALLQLPESVETELPSLTAMAQQWDAESALPKEDVIGRARFLEHKLATSEHFRYRLGGVIREYGTDPVEDFIRNHPEGHCEYFASALALMLRSVGIGSRIVVGFKTDCVLSDEGEYSVRQSDAHSWVEAYVPRESISREILESSDVEQHRGAAINPLPARRPPFLPFSRVDWWDFGAWLRLDPTPEAAVIATDRLRFSWRDFLRDLQDGWNDLVLNMNTSKQTQYVYAPLARGASWVAEHVFRIDYWKRILPEIVAKYKQLFDDFRAGQGRLKNAILLVVPPVLLLLVLALLLHFLARRLRLRSFLTLTGTGRRARTTVGFYLRLEKVLARLDMVREPAQTQAAFLRHCAVQLPKPLSLEMIADAFYRVRFGGQTLTEAEKTEIETTLARLAEIVKMKK